jgi:hypothetical protein
MNQIRAIHERRPDNDNAHGRIMVYQVGSYYTIKADESNKPIKRKITDIVLVDNIFKVYIGSETEKMLWKEIGRTEFVSVEYVVDLE